MKAPCFLRPPLLLLCFDCLRMRRSQKVRTEYRETSVKVKVSLYFFKVHFESIRRPHLSPHGGLPASHMQMYSVHTQALNDGPVFPRGKRMNTFPCLIV